MIFKYTKKNKMYVFSCNQCLINHSVHKIWIILSQVFIIISNFKSIKDLNIWAVHGNNILKQFCKIFIATKITSIIKHRITKNIMKFAAVFRVGFIMNNSNVEENYYSQTE